jgi:thymidylate synthase
MLREVLMEGSSRPDRTGTGTTSLFGGRIEYDLRNGFPLITSKRVPFRLVAEELLWFLRGEEDIRYLQDRDVHIWDEWADKYGYIGPMYGFQWRRWGEDYDDYGLIPGVDQIAQVIESVKTDPYSRRHVVSTWNPTAIPEMALAPCHIMFQFYVEEDDVLSIQVYQRS